jgi:hypothetical protein
VAYLSQHRRAWRRNINLQARFQRGTLRDLRRTVSLLHRRPKDLVLPHFEFSEDVTMRSIRGTHLSNPCSTSLFDQAIDERRYLLVRLCPVAMSTAKDGIRYTLQLRLFRVIELSDEVCGIVCWLALVRRGNDNDWLVCWKVPLYRIQDILHRQPADWPVPHMSQCSSRSR